MTRTLRNKSPQAVFKNSTQPSHLSSFLNSSFVTHLFQNKTKWLLGFSVAVLFSVVIGINSQSKAVAASLSDNKLHQLSLEIPAAPLVSLTADIAAQDKTTWQQVTVKKGQTLSSIFDQLDLSQTLLYKIVHTNKKAKQLTKIYPGAVIKIARDEKQQFSQLKYKFSATDELVVKKNADELTAEIVQHSTEVNVFTVHGVISGSLFNAGKKAGLTDAMVMNLANIFAWDIDFILDIRAGDSFSLIYEKIYQDGEFLRDGKILAASFTNQGDDYRAVVFDDGNGDSYYNPEGRNMKKAFLRAPLNFSYISSNFNPKRFHPIQKRVKPHRGIDYRAPKGTPVVAAGNGVVTKSGYNKYNGNYVFIKHPNGIVTKYLHFTKKYVKKRQHVKQGQTIGTVGSTGMATAAHLHYEFVLNGVHRNPKTVKLPKASPLKKNKMPAFQAYATPMLSQLESINVSVKNIALDESESKENKESKSS